MVAGAMTGAVAVDSSKLSLTLDVFLDRPSA